MFQSAEGCAVLLPDGPIGRLKANVLAVSRAL